MIIEQSATFFAWPLLPFVQPFSKPVSSFGTLKVFTTHMPSNPAFFQVMKSVSVSVHNQPGQFNQTPMICNVQHDDDAFCKEHNQSASSYQTLLLPRPQDPHRMPYFSSCSREPQTPVLQSHPNAMNNSVHSFFGETSYASFTGEEGRELLSAPGVV